MMLNKKILVLRFPYSSTLGGGELHTLTLAEELEKKGLEFKLLSSCRVLLNEFAKRHWDYKKIWLGQEPVSKSSLIIFPLFIPWIILRMSLNLFYHRLKGFKVIFCLSLTEKIILTPIAKLLGYKIVWMEHLSIGRWLTLNPYRPLYWLWSRLANIVTVSEAVKMELINIGIPDDRIRVIYHGIDLAKKPAEEKKSSELFVVGAISRLDKEKGVEYLLQAAKIAAEFINNLRIIIVGDGEERKNLEWLAKKLNLEQKVLFVGWQNNPDEWLINFDVFVLPSIKRESFGLVLLQAMLCQKPVIASDLGGVPEVVADQTTGLLVKPGDAGALAQAIIDLRRQPERMAQMGQAGYERVKEKFNLEKMVERYYQVFTRK